MRAPGGNGIPFAYANFRCVSTRGSEAKSNAFVENELVPISPRLSPLVSQFLVYDVEQRLTLPEPFELGDE
jgi:hypothetical protein